MAKGYFHEKAGRVAPVNYAKMIITIILDAVIFKEKLHLQECIGASLIILCTFTIGILKLYGVIDWFLFVFINN